MTLHGYFRSSASWRVRIALGLKGLDHESIFYHLRRGEQRSPRSLAINPQGLVPALELDDGVVLTQSLAIIDYLDEIHPEPALLPSDPLSRAKVRGFAQAIACDIHPVQNLKILERLRAMGQDEDGVRGWVRDIVEEGLDACARLIAGRNSRFAFGDIPSLADICLVPQLANARRFGAEMRWSDLLRIEAACAALPSFAAARPENQPDAE